MSRRSLYKYFTKHKWADAFLDGEILFRSLAYFRDLEDENVREDQNEGVSVFQPTEGLQIINQTQGTQFTMKGFSFEATVKQKEIFVFCYGAIFFGEVLGRYLLAASGI
jgi:hypothetical protein